ncbi:hypothetical protein ACEPAG_272 [Sanghuangporus baumii]
MNQRGRSWRPQGQQNNPPPPPWHSASGLPAVTTVLDWGYSSLGLSFETPSPPPSPPPSPLAWSVPDNGLPRAGSAPRQPHQLQQQLQQQYCLSSLARDIGCGSGTEGSKKRDHSAMDEQIDLPYPSLKKRCTATFLAQPSPSPLPGWQRQQQQQQQTQGLPPWLRHPTSTLNQAGPSRFKGSFQSMQTDFLREEDEVDWTLVELSRDLGYIQHLLAQMGHIIQDVRNWLGEMNAKKGKGKAKQ